MTDDKATPHSIYADGTIVRKGQQPRRITGPDVTAHGPHSILRWDTINHRVYQAREFDINNYPVRDIDFTNPTFSDGSPRPNHPGPPHQQRWEVNNAKIGPRSNFKRSKVREPLD